MWLLTASFVVVTAAAVITTDPRLLQISIWLGIILGFVIYTGMNRDKG